MISIIFNMGLFGWNKKSKTHPEPDWGEISPEGYNEEKNSALLAFNVDMESETSREMAKKFIAGRVLWYKRHLPVNSSFLVFVDLRGQDEIAAQPAVREKWQQEMLSAIQQSEPGIKIDVNIKL